MHSLSILILARTKEIMIELYLLILLLQKSQWLYLAQGNGILQLEGKTEEKEKTIQKLISGSNEEKKNCKTGTKL